MVSCSVHSMTPTPSSRSTAQEDQSLSTKWREPVIVRMSGHRTAVTGRHGDLAARDTLGCEEVERLLVLHHPAGLVSWPSISTRARASAASRSSSLMAHSRWSQVIARVLAGPRDPGLRLVLASPHCLATPRQSGR